MILGPKALIIRERRAKKMKNVFKSMKKVFTGTAMIVLTLGVLAFGYTPVANASPETDALELRIAALESLLMHVSRSGTELTITGANLNIVNGTGTTTGDVNGLGNLVVGYNEFRIGLLYPGVEDPRTGSHNIVLGTGLGYSSYSGVVLGQDSNVSAPFATILGGKRNIASGENSTIAGGVSNRASGYSSAVSGGYLNEATGSSSVISGGFDHYVSGQYDWAAGSLFEEE